MLQVEINVMEINEKKRLTKQTINCKIIPDEAGRNPNFTCRKSDYSPGHEETIHFLSIGIKGAKGNKKESKNHVEAGPNTKRN